MPWQPGESRDLTTLSSRFLRRTFVLFGMTIRNVETMDIKTPPANRRRPVGIALPLARIPRRHPAVDRGLVMPLIHGALYYKSGLYADCSMQAYTCWRGCTGGSCGAGGAEKTDAGLTGPEDAEGAKRAAAPAHGHTPLRTVPALAGSTPRRTSGCTCCDPASRTAPYPSGTRGPRRCRSWRCGCSAQAGGAMARVAGRGSGDRRAFYP